MFLYSLIFVGVLVNFSFALKILVNSPNIGFSHVQFQGKIADTLVDGGHEVHFLISVYNEKSDYNGTQKSHKIIRFHSEQPIKYDDITMVRNPFDSNRMDERVFKEWHDRMDIFCYEMTKNGSWLLEDLKVEKYDVAITEPYEACIFGIFEAVGIKTKVITSAVPLPDGLAELFGIPLPRSYIPNAFNAPVSAPKMSYLEKWQTLYDAYKIEMFPFKNSNEVLQNAFGKDFPDVKDIMRKTPFVFVNIHEFLDQLKPISNKVVHIGGIALKAPKKLDESLTPIFQKAKKGVVLFSFGSITNTDLMPEAYRHAYLESFAKFPDYEFIWKYNFREQDKALFLKYPNVHPVNWLDQTSILAHPKTKGFMTHCGLNSFIEGSYAGVPFIATPLFGDQNYNAAIIRSKETGVYLDIKKVTIETITEALHQVLETDKYDILSKIQFSRYYQNAQKLKKKLTSFPYKPADRVVKFVEYAHENSIEDDLNLPGADMNFVEYFCLDVIIPPVIGLLILAYVVCRSLYRIVGFIVGTFGVDVKNVKVD